MESGSYMVLRCLAWCQLADKTVGGAGIDSCFTLALVWNAKNKAKGQAHGHSDGLIVKLQPAACNA